MNFFNISVNKLFAGAIIVAAMFLPFHHAYLTITSLPAILPRFTMAVGQISIQVSMKHPIPVGMSIFAIILLREIPPEGMVGVWDYPRKMVLCVFITT